MTTKKTFVRWAMMGAMTLALLVSFADSGRGQEARATIGGRVVDAQGAIVAGAQVVVVSEDTGVKQTTTTNSDGNWSVRFLIPGRYHFTVGAPGFKQAVSNGIELQTADIRAIDVELAVGSASDHITVTDEAPLIDTTAATSGTVINQKQMLEMPTNSRVVTLFATLSPGVLQQDQNNNVFQLWSFNAASQFTVNGGTNNSRSTAFELDGMPNMMYGGKVAFIAPPDSLQEFRVLMNAYDASIGRQAGGTIQMSFRSGTAHYHGNLFEINQNRVLNANYFQANLSGSPSTGGALQRIWRHVRRAGLDSESVQRQAEDLLFRLQRRHPEDRPGDQPDRRADRAGAAGRFQPVFHHAAVERADGAVPDPGLRPAERGRQRKPDAFRRRRDSGEPAERDFAEHSQVRVSAQPAERPHRKRHQ